MELSGFRSSCETTPRNSSLARLAVSAATRAVWVRSRRASRRSAARLACSRALAISVASLIRGPGRGCGEAAAARAMGSERPARAEMRWVSFQLKTIERAAVRAMASAAATVTGRVDFQRKAATSAEKIRMERRAPAVRTRRDDRIFTRLASRRPSLSR